jgi:ribosome-binding ATPase YchF (GTP1/OBG family)
MAKAEAALESKGAPVFKEVLDVLNSEKALSQVLGKDILDSIKEYAFLTAKPLIILKSIPEEIPFGDIFKATSSIMFFTVGPKESKAWLIKEQSTVIEAAAKIHTDLAKGFIRAEVYNIKDLDSFHNVEEAKQKGILKIVDREYILNDGDLIKIRFNVQK